VSLQDLFERPQYSIPQQNKEAILLPALNELTAYHLSRCPGYERIVSALKQKPPARRLSDLPYLPVSLFKQFELSSIDPERRFKVLTSSGTTGQAVSRIFLDEQTASDQTLALTKIMTSILGGQRLPMLIVDSKKLLNSREKLSARAAGVVGMMSFGRHPVFVLNDDMELDVSALSNFLHKFGDAPFLIFGFTFMVWAYFLEKLKATGTDLSNAILVHSGGWKKLEELAVSNQVFHERFREVTGLRRIYSFYGMVEQVGSVFLEGEDGYLYAPNFADVIIRDPRTLEECPPGVAGVIQVLSLIPKSYPGHSLLTEDLGVLHGADDGSCGRHGKYFTVIGRVPKTELRGCSDVHAYSH